LTIITGNTTKTKMRSSCQQKLLLLPPRTIRARMQQQSSKKNALPSLFGQLHRPTSNFSTITTSTTLRAIATSFSTSASSSYTATATAISSTTTTWQRSAIKVKNTNNNDTTTAATTAVDAVSKPYLERIRDLHDPSKHIKTLEDELLGSIGQALGKQGQKVESCIRTMKKHWQAYEQALAEVQQQETNPSIGQRADDKVLVQKNQKAAAAAAAAASAYNDARQRAIQARWELLVHRQAAGFLVDNHNHVTKLYPIPGPALQLPDDDDQNDVVVQNVVVVVQNDSHDEMSNKNNTDSDDQQQQQQQKTNKTIFGDQLDWWQRIGRWK
jgi:hypothetical protein